MILSIRESIQHGIHTEVKQYGLGIDKVLFGTMVFSYADMAANYAGLAFWLKLHPHNIAIAPPGFLEQFQPQNRYANITATSPYFECDQEKGVWKMTRPFRWIEYVNPDWDETINTNEYRTQQMKDKFMNRIQELRAQGKLPSATFPMQPELCKQLSRSWNLVKEDLRMYVNPICFELAFPRSYSNATSTAPPS